MCNDNVRKFIEITKWQVYRFIPNFLWQNFRQKILWELSNFFPLVKSFPVDIYLRVDENFLIMKNFFINVDSLSSCTLMSKIYEIVIANTEISVNNYPTNMSQAGGPKPWRGIRKINFFWKLGRRGTKPGYPIKLVIHLQNYTVCLTWSWGF